MQGRSIERATATRNRCWKDGLNTGLARGPWEEGENVEDAGKRGTFELIPNLDRCI